MEGAQRATLRKLAVNLGLVEASAKSFSIPRDTLVEKLKDKVPDIDAMTEAEVQKMIDGGGNESVKAPSNGVTTKPGPKPGPAASAPARPGPKPGPRAVAKEEPAEEAEAEAEDQVEETPAPRAKPGPKPGMKPGPRPSASATETQSDATPVKRGPGRPPGPRPAAPAVTREDTAVRTETRTEAAPKATVDLTPIVERLDAIGQLVDKANKGNDVVNSTVKGLAGDIKELKATLDSIAGYLTWQYNAEVTDGEQVESITKIDWSA